MKTKELKMTKRYDNDTENVKRIKKMIDREFAIHAVVIASATLAVIFGVSAILNVIIK